MVSGTMKESSFGRLEKDWQEEHRDELNSTLECHLERKSAGKSAKCKFLHNCLSRNSIPKGILPTLHIKMSDPLAYLNNK